MPVEMPGRATILRWAAATGVNVDATMAKADMLLAPDPDAMKAGGEQLGQIREGLQAGERDATRLGTEMSNGWSGAAADTFVPRVATLGEGTAQTDTSLAGLQQHLTSVADDSAARINAVCNASAVTAAFLDAQAIAASPAGPPAAV